MLVSVVSLASNWAQPPCTRVLMSPSSLPLTASLSVDLSETWTQAPQPQCMPVTLYGIIVCHLFPCWVEESGVYHTCYYNNCITHYHAGLLMSVTHVYHTLLTAMFIMAAISLSHAALPMLIYDYSSLYPTFPSHEFHKFTHFHQTLVTPVIALCIACIFTWIQCSESPMHRPQECCRRLLPACAVCCLWTRVNTLFSDFY